MSTKETMVHQCDICGRKVKGMGADPYKSYNKFRWVVLTYTSTGHDPMDSGSFENTNRFDICPDCIDIVQAWLFQTMRSLKEWDKK